MTNLPEAGGVAYADLFTKEGVMICVTARAETPGMAIKNLLAAIEESGLATARNGNGQPAPQPVQPASNPESVSVAGSNLGLLTSKPKASELNPGDRYEIQVEEYKATPVKIDFLRAGMQYPYVSHNMTNDIAIGKFTELFKGWHPEEDDERHPIPGGAVILAIQCTTKLNSHNNPYQNLDGMRRP